MENQKQKQTLFGLTIAGISLMLITTLAAWMVVSPSPFLIFWLGFLPSLSASIGFAGIGFFIMSAVFKKQETEIKTKSVILLAAVISVTGLIGWQIIQYFSTGLPINPRDLMLTVAGGAVFLIAGLMSGEK